MRNRSRDPDLRWTRKARWFHQDGDPSRSWPESNLWMFAQDVGTDVWWYLRGAGEREFGDGPNIIVRDCSQQVHDLVAASLPAQGDWHRYERIGKVLGDFAKDIAQSWVLGMDADFEVCGGWNATPRGDELEDVRLLRIPSGSLILRRGVPYQQIPAHAPSDRIAEIIPLEAARIVRMRAPGSLGKMLARVRLGLDTIGRLDPMRMGDINSYSRHGEAFGAVAREFARRRAAVTREVGWYGRFQFDEYMNRHHQIMRRFAWERMIILVRNAIMSYVRDVFTIVGSWCKENPRLLCLNFVDTQAVDALERSFLRGDLTINEVEKHLDRFRPSDD